MKTVYLFVAMSILTVRSQAQSEWNNQLTELGFYLVRVDTAQLLEFIPVEQVEDDHSTQRMNDHIFIERNRDAVRSLENDQFIVIYGDAPSPSVSLVREFTGMMRPGQAKEWTLASFFHMEPVAPRHGQKVTKLIPKKQINNGIYFIQKCSPLESKAYIPFRLNREPRLTFEDRSRLEEVALSFWKSVKNGDFEQAAKLYLSKSDLIGVLERAVIADKLSREMKQLREKHIPRAQGAEWKSFEIRRAEYHNGFTVVEAVVIYAAFQRDRSFGLAIINVSDNIWKISDVDASYVALK